MSVILNEAQLKALGRLYRTYSIDKMTLTEHPGTKDWIIGNIIFTTGQEKRFVLNEDGGLAKNASNKTDSEHLSV
jgi:hypothetical protein